MVQVYDIFTTDPVDPGVKKSAGDQLAIMMKGSLFFYNIYTMLEGAKYCDH